MMLKLSANRGSRRHFYHGDIKITSLIGKPIFNDSTYRKKRRLDNRSSSRATFKNSHVCFCSLASSSSPSQESKSSIAAWFFRACLVLTTGNVFDETDARCQVNLSNILWVLLQLHKVTIRESG